MSFFHEIPKCQTKLSLSLMTNVIEVPKGFFLRKSDFVSKAVFPFLNSEPKNKVIGMEFDKHVDVDNAEKTVC